MALCHEVEAAVDAGVEVVILSDRLGDEEEPELERPPIPTLLAVGAVHHHLIRCARVQDSKSMCQQDALADLGFLWLWHEQWHPVGCSLRLKITLSFGCNSCICVSDSVCPKNNFQGSGQPSWVTGRGLRSTAWRAPGRLGCSGFP